MKEYGKPNLEFTIYKSYQQYLDQKILPALGHLKLSKIQPMHLQSFYNNLLEDGIRKDGKDGGYSPSTIRNSPWVINGRVIITFSFNGMVSR